jgi:hypothetical protein
MATMDTTTDMDEIWKDAIDEFENTAKVKIGNLSLANNVKAVLNETSDTRKDFEKFRHDDTKLDKFRKLVGNSLGLIEKIGGMIASAASTVGDQPHTCSFG